MIDNYEKPEKLCKTKEELIAFVKELNTEMWEQAFILPEPRYPIMAIVRVGGQEGDYDNDDMEVCDEATEDFIVENNGTHIPVCGVSYDGGSYNVITPFSTSAADKADPVTFINWQRVLNWRYLTQDEALYKWQSLVNELPKDSEVQK